MYDYCGSAGVPCATLNNGVQMPTLAFGTWDGSFSHVCPGGRFTNATCLSHYAYDVTLAWLRMGGRMIDTAQLYRTQVPVGMAILDSGVPREDVFLETKCSGANGYVSIVECLDDNLQMLQTSYVDLVRRRRQPSTVTPTLLAVLLSVSLSL